MRKILSLFSKNKNAFLFGIVILLALFFRFYKLGSAPKSIHLDETVNAYVGRYILSNGFDLYGNPFPLFYFDKFGDFPPVIPMYIQALGTYLFGFSEVGSRFIVALIGFLVVLQVFLIARLIFKDIRAALFAGFTAAIMPWQIVFSRTSAEGLIASFFYLWGLFFLLKFVKKTQTKYLLFSLPFLFFTFFLYPAFRIITPLTFLPLPFLLYSKKNIKPVFYSAIILIFSFVVLLWLYRTPWGQGRADQVSIFNPVSGVAIRNTQLIFDDGDQPALLTRIFHNKLLGYAREFLGQYFSYFDGRFLFTKGGGEITHQVPNNGALYITYLFLFLVPLSARIKARNKKSVDHKLFYYIVYLLLVSPIAGALTVIAVPNPHRAFLMAIMLTFVLSYGFASLLDFKIKRVRIDYLILIFLAAEVIFFAHNYFKHIDVYQLAETNAGAKEAVRYVAEKKDEYKDVFITGSNYMSVYYLYFTADLNPRLAGEFATKLIIDKYENLQFFDTDCPINRLEDVKDTAENKILIINRGECTLPHLKGIKKLADFNSGYNTIAFQAFVWDPDVK